MLDDLWYVMLMSLVLILNLFFLIGGLINFVSKHLKPFIELKNYTQSFKEHLLFYVYLSIVLILLFFGFISYKGMMKSMDLALRNYDYKSLEKKLSICEINKK